MISASLLSRSFTGRAKVWVTSLKRSRAGRFWREKADALGIPSGPVRRDLVEGQAVRLADGRQIEPEDVLGEERRGTALCTWATAATPTACSSMVRDADGLVIEVDLPGRRARDGPAVFAPDRADGGGTGAQSRGEEAHPDPRFAALP